MPKWLEGIAVIFGIWCALYLILDPLLPKSEKVVPFASRDERTAKLAQRRRDALLGLALLAVALIVRAIWGK